MIRRREMLGRNPSPSRRGRFPHAAWLLVVALLAFPAAIQAQTPSVAVPPNLILPNFDRLPVGQQEGIEAGAFLARTGDAGSNWYNPAGLAKSEKSAVNASATAYEWTSTELEGLGEVAGKSRISSVGTLFSAVLGSGPLKSERWRLGFSIASPILWKPSRIDLAFDQQGGQEEVAYSTDGNFDVMIPAVAVAFAPGGVKSGTFRVGAGLGLAMTSLKQFQAASDRVTTPTSQSVELRSFAGDGSSWDLKFNAGIQWEANPNLILAARGATPTLGVRGSSQMNLQSLQVNTPRVQDLVFRDAEAVFKYKLPAEAQVGAAVIGKKGQIEVDIHYYGAIDPYDMYSSTATGVLTVDTTGTPVTSPVTLAPTPNSNRSVVNVSVGGSYPLTAHLSAHAGFASDRSPVPDGGQSIFRQIDLNRLTGGFSLAGSNLSGSLGFGYSFGSGTRSGTVTGQNGTPVETRLKVRTANLLFALTYSFARS
jgi:long-subunit fatty acid transport protein